MTAGDPCGVGPELVLASLPVLRRQRAVVIGDPPVFRRAARALGQRPPRWPVVRDLREAPADAPVMLLDAGGRAAFTAGRPSRAAGAAALRYLKLGAALARDGVIDALVTAPVTKWAIERTGTRFVGQTEFLARALHARDVVMMFTSDTVRVVLATRHLPLSAVPRAATRRRMRVTLERTLQALHVQFKIRRPRIAVCGLNPHAGEGGLFGHEERRVLHPVLAGMRRRGVRCDGPFAADALFPRRAGRYDAVVCWYHDQGLIPFKLLAGDHGCQVSLGLPIVRTSPDHGSALDIAGRGTADSGSMRYALAVAARLASTPLTARLARC